jgi:hypothetical protein
MCPNQTTSQEPVEAAAQSPRANSRTTTSVLIVAFSILLPLALYRFIGMWVLVPATVLSLIALGYYGARSSSLSTRIIYWGLFLLLPLAVVWYLIAVSSLIL